MVVVFPFAFGGLEKDDHLELGWRFIEENRKRNPSVRFIQITDRKTRPVRGVDECRRYDPAPFGLWYFDAICAIEGPYLRLDYDCLMLRDVSGVFAHDFDIAIAKEHNGEMNNGVVFVRNREILKAAKEKYKETEQDNWLDIQRAMQVVIDSGRFRVKKLSTDYNYFFKNNRPVPKTTQIIHFKGAAKGLMLDFYDGRWQPLGG